MSNKILTRKILTNKGFLGKKIQISRKFLTKYPNLSKKIFRDTVINKMDQVKETLKSLNFSDKEIAVYITLLSLGPAPIRKIGEKADVNRGTTHEALRKLQKEGLVAYYHKEKHQYFVAEDPNILNTLLKKKKTELDAVNENLKQTIPQLRSLFSGNDNRPVVKYYEDTKGVRTILEDVLSSCEILPKKEYVIYSSRTIRPFLYEANVYPDYTEERIKRKIYVRTISIGEGGKESGLDERRWLTKTESAPVYTFIYANKIAFISVDKRNKLHGVIIEDQHLFETQKLIFEHVWLSLK